LLTTHFDGWMGRRWIKIEKEGVQFLDLNPDYFLSFFL
jgi:hypothetical protein